MRKLRHHGVNLAAAAATQVGCFVPIYSSSPDVRAKELIYESESLRHIPESGSGFGDWTCRTWRLRTAPMAA